MHKQVEEVGLIQETFTNPHTKYLKSKMVLSMEQILWLVITNVFKIKKNYNGIAPTLEYARVGIRS